MVLKSKQGFHLSYSSWGRQTNITIDGTGSCKELKQQSQGLGRLLRVGWSIILFVSNSAQASSFTVCHPPSPYPLNSTWDKSAQSATASPPHQLVCIYENSSATGILRAIKFSTRENRKEAIYAEEIRKVSTPPLRMEFVPEFTTSGGNSLAVSSHQELGNIPSLEFGSWELGAC